MEATASSQLLGDHLPDADGFPMEATASPLLTSDHLRDADGSTRDFYISGYQPARKWLKDRKGCELTFDDIAHYRKIIAVLLETNVMMKLIDENGE